MIFLIPSTEPFLYNNQSCTLLELLDRGASSIDNPAAQLPSPSRGLHLHLEVSTNKELTRHDCGIVCGLALCIIKAFFGEG
jgi:hypothetical protein